MSTSDPSQLDDLSATEELTAYLDGEVDAEHARRIEERLARDEGYRRQLLGLQRTWDMLDQLPQARVDEAFLKSTIEMVAQAAAEDVQASRQSVPRRRHRRWLLTALGFAAAAAIGFLVGSYVWPDADREVLLNLPLIEDFDVYQMRNPDTELATALLQAGLFLEDADSKEPIPDDLPGRREWVAARPAGKQDELRRNWERFKELRPEQQEKLQALAAELSANPQKRQLLEIEARYRQWYAGLKQPQQAELVNFPLEERVKQITKFREPPLTPADLEVTAKWFEEKVFATGSELVSEKDRKEFQALSGEEQQRRRGMIAGRAAWQLRGPDSDPPISDADYRKLQGQLSPSARAPLAAAVTTRDKWGVVQSWLFHANFYVYALSQQEREDLRPLSGAEFYQQLHELMSRRFEMMPRGPWRGPGDRPRGAERRRGDDERQRGERGPRRDRRPDADIHDDKSAAEQQDNRSPGFESDKDAAENSKPVLGDEKSDEKSSDTE